MNILLGILFALIALASLIGAVLVEREARERYIFVFGRAVSTFLERHEQMVLNGNGSPSPDPANPKG